MIIIYRKYALGFCLFILNFYILLQINVNDLLKQIWTSDLSCYIFKAI